MAQRRRPAAYGLPGDLGWEMPGWAGSLVPPLGSGYGDWREKKNPHKKKTQPKNQSHPRREPAPSSSSAKSPWKLQKNPPNPGPYGLLVLAVVGEKKIKINIEEPFAGLFTKGNSAPLEEAGCWRDKRGAKVPTAPRALAKSRSQRCFNPISPGISALGEGAKILAPPAKPAPTPYAQELGVGYFYPSLKLLIFRKLEIPAVTAASALCTA